MSLQTVAEEYFKNINPIATRIYEDFGEVKSNYEDLWSSLSEKQKEQLLSETIIKPEVSIKYLAKAQDKSQTDYAVKLIHDDHCSYRDEHSGPFSFKTQSQRNLSIFETEKEQIVEKPIMKPKPKKKPVVYVDDNLIKVEIESEDLSNVPRTGLDFLDNW